MPTLLAIVGPSGSGKTTLIEKLVPLLRAGGLTVGVIKNDAHGFQMDREGKDSDRFFKSGADGVLIQSPAELAYRRAQPERRDPAVLAEAFFGDCDVVLVEGGKDTELPKIEMWRSATHAAPPALPPADRVALVTDTREAHEEIDGVPAFEWNDVAGIRDLILRRARA